MPESLDHFLATAVDAGKMKIHGEDDRSPAVAAPPNAVRPGTDRFAKDTTVTMTKKTTKKRTKKKSALRRAPNTVAREKPTIFSVAGALEDGTAPAVAMIAGYTPEEIAIARQILQDIDKSGHQLDTNAHPLTPEVVVDPEHTAVANEFNIDDIDEVDPPETPPVTLAPTNVTPPGLVEHECGLPACLLNKKALIAYLETHGISQKDREKLELTDDEKALYELYTRMQKMRRVSLGHFTAGLRLWRKGYPVNPKDSVDLNSMKVGD